MNLPRLVMLAPTLALAACASSPPPASSPTAHHHGEHDGHHGDANAHMHHASFEELIARFEDPERAVWQKPDSLIQTLGPLAGKTVADLGAGTGYFSVRLAAAGAEVLAVDVEPKFVEYIASRAKTDPQGARIHPRLAAFDDPKLDPASVDVVLLVDVYHHIEAREGYFRKLLAAFRPSGQLVVVDFKKGSLPVGPPDELKLPAEQVVRELTAAGYVDATVDSSTLPYQYIVRTRTPTRGPATP